jgi:hypothetical protein
MPPLWRTPEASRQPPLSQPGTGSGPGLDAGDGKALMPAGGNGLYMLWLPYCAAADGCSGMREMTCGTALLGCLGGAVRQGSSASRGGSPGASLQTGSGLSAPATPGDSATCCCSDCCAAACCCPDGGCSGRAGTRGSSGSAVARPDAVALIATVSNVIKTGQRPANILPVQKRRRRCSAGMWPSRVSFTPAVALARLSQLWPRPASAHAPANISATAFSPAVRARQLSRPVMAHGNAACAATWQTAAPPGCAWQRKKAGLPQKPLWQHLSFPE